MSRCSADMGRPGSFLTVGMGTGNGRPRREDPSHQEALTLAYWSSTAATHPDQLCRAARRLRQGPGCDIRQTRRRGILPSLIQTAFYGLFAGWALWWQGDRKKPFKWEDLAVPREPVLQIEAPVADQGAVRFAPVGAQRKAGAPEGTPVWSSVWLELTERFWLEMQISLDRQTQRPSGTLELRKREVTPFALLSDDVSEEQKVNGVL